MNFFYRYLRSKTIHSCKSYTKSFFSTLFVVFCFEITFKIVKMRSISAVDFFSYEFVISEQEFGQIVLQFLLEMKHLKKILKDQVEVPLKAST